MSRKPTLAGIGINAGARAVPVVPEAARAVVEEKRVSGKSEKACTVRLNFEAWCEARDFATRQGKSLQDLFVDGLNMIRASKGLPPLPGTGKGE
jgi:hypothetical protein